MRFLTKLCPAILIFGALAAYLYRPYVDDFKGPEWLLPVNAGLAALGCYVLSLRWIPRLEGSLIAGAVYGFSPFMLSLDNPTAGLLAALVPWALCPGTLAGRKQYRWTALPLALLRFLVTLLAFRISAAYRIFAIPLHPRFKSDDLVSFVVPLVWIRRHMTPIGVYHVPVAALVMGLVMTIKARRLGVIALLISGAVLAFCEPLFDVGPTIWLTIPLACCAVMIGAGTQAVVSAGFKDRRYVLAAAIAAAALAIISLLLATKYFQFFLSLADRYAKLLTREGMMYALGAVAMLAIYLIIRARLRLHWLRWTIISAAMAADIFLGATFIVDRVL